MPTLRIDIRIPDSMLEDNKVTTESVIDMMTADARRHIKREVEMQRGERQFFVDVRLENAGH